MRLSDNEDKPAKQEVVSPESSIEVFLEKWRRSWEEGDLQTYISCYLSGFTARGMDIQARENYKKDLFSRTPERPVQISDIQIEPNSSSAVVTFKHRYQTAKHQDLGFKTLYLRQHGDKWTILKENWQSISGKG